MVTVRVMLEGDTQKSMQVFGKLDYLTVLELAKLF